MFVCITCAKSAELFKSGDTFAAYVNTDWIQLIMPTDIPMCWHICGGTEQVNIHLYTDKGTVDTMMDKLRMPKSMKIEEVVVTK